MKRMQTISQLRLTGINAQKEFTAKAIEYRRKAMKTLLQCRAAKKQKVQSVKH